MKLKIQYIDIDLDVLIISSKDASKLEILASSIIKLTSGEKNLSGRVIKTSQVVIPGVIGIPSSMTGIFAPDEIVDVVSIHSPENKRIIDKFLKSNMSLSEEEIKSLVTGISNDSLTPIQTTAFMLYHHFKQVDIKEVEMLAKSFADSGNRITWKSPAYDKHSIGGVPGNKVSLLIVPILAAAGLLTPKTSTKAITSASGTVDTMGVLAEVDFTPDEVMEIANKTKGIIISGEKLGIAPTIDKVITNAGYPLGLDPPSLILAGVISKKIAMGIDFMVLDIPVGKGTKFVESDGRVFGRTFVDLAHAVGISAKCGITYGDVPVGHTIGPALEAREGLSTLIDPSSGPNSLIEKSTSLAGLVIELAGIANRGQGQSVADDILRSGKAYKKMKEIIEAQGGDPNIKPDDIELGSYTMDIVAPANGWVIEIKNRALTQIARASGAPEHPGAGIHLLTKKESVKKGELVARIYAHSEHALEEVRAQVAKLQPIVIEGLLLGTIS
ncbi:MAG: AMP phosphorylase [Candidatus Heimdallarchaeota archaeon LC_3]|nr:MAG: AMP phosphorylase [Candidatus Heimdallarchaeota archaeon LC_3]